MEKEVKLSWGLGIWPAINQLEEMIADAGGTIINRVTFRGDNNNTVTYTLPEGTAIKIIPPNCGIYEGEIPA